jgi:hypothetical protein
VISECFRESDVVDAVRSGEWPDRCEQGLRDHVAGCDVCRDVAAVAAALQASRAEGLGEVHVPTSAHVWWRAQLRARREALELAASPMTIVQGVAAACAAGLAIAAIGMGWGELASASRHVASELIAAATSAPELTLTFLGAAAVVLAMPIAVYFALSEK